MKKRAFILVNLIVIMTFLNMIILTVLVIRSKALNSSKLAISNKTYEIYNKSKLEIIDSEILGRVKTSLKQLEDENNLDEKSLYNKMNAVSRLGKYVLHFYCTTLRFLSIFALQLWRYQSPRRTHIGYFALCYDDKLIALTKFAIVVRTQFV